MNSQIRNILKPFALGRIESAITIFKAIDGAGFTVDDLAEYVAGVRAEDAAFAREAQEALAARMAGWEEHAPRCPDCGKTLLIIAVNTSPGYQVGGSSRSMWQCPDLMNCGYERASDLAVMEEIVASGIPGYVVHKKSPGPMSDGVRRVRAKNAAMRRRS